MSSFEAIRADVVFQTVGVDGAKLGAEEIRHNVVAAYSGITTEALKAAAAQTKFDKSFTRAGGDVAKQRAAVLRYRQEMSALEGQTDRVARSTDNAGRSFERFGRGALTGTGVLHGLGRAAGYASASFLGGAGVVYAIRSTIKAAEESQRVLGQTANAVRDSGNDWQAYAAKINASTQKTSVKFAFDDEDLLGTFSTLVRATGDVNRALTLNGVAAEVARGKNTSLEAATNLVVKATMGQAGALRRLSINAPKGATALQLINLLTVKYAKAAEVYGRSAEAAQDRFGVALENTQETIGTKALPQITQLLNKGSEWLNQSKNQKIISDDVNRALSDGEKIVRGLAEAERLLAPPIHLAIKALGGLEQAATDALILRGVLSAKKYATSFGLISAASGKARTAVVADAAVEEAALAGVGAKVSGLRSGLLGLASKPFVIAAILDVTTNFLPQSKTAPNPIKGLPIAGRLFGFGEKLGDYGAALTGHPAQQQGPAAVSPLAFWLKAGKLSKDAGTPRSITDNDVWVAIMEHHLGASGLQKLKPYFVSDDAYKAAQDFAASIAPPPATGRGVNLPSSITGNSPTGAGALTAAGRNQLALSAAGRTSSTADDLKALTDERVLLGKKIATETARLKTAVDAKQAGKYAANLEALQAQDSSAFSQITSINQAAAQKRSSAAAKVLRDQHAAEARAAKDYREGVSSTVQGLRDSIAKGLRGETQGIGTRIVGGKVVATNATFTEPTDGQKLRALLKKESTDQKLSKAERDRYRHLYSADLLAEAKDADAFNSKVSSILKKARAAQAAKLKEQQDIRDAILGNRLTAAQLAEAKAGTNATALKKAQQQELAAELAIIANDRRHEKGLTGAALQAARAQTLQDEIAYQQLKNQTASSGQSPAAFFAEAADERQTYGGNIGEGPLSGQDARGMLGQIAGLLRENNRHARATAASTGSISKSKVSMIDTARRGY